LVTYADTQETDGTGAHMYDRMLARMTAPNNTMPPTGPVSNADQELIRRWVDTGAPEGPSVTPPTPPMECGTEPSGPGTPWLTLSAHESGGTGAYSVPQAADENVYTCFGFTVSNASKVHITRFHPIIDNAAVLHHIVLYRDQGFDDQSVPDGPFGCGDNDGSMQVDWGFLYGWAPGTSGMVFPDDVGMPLEANSRLVLQMHYHPTPGLPPLDQSGVQIFASDTLRPNEAGMVAVGPTGFEVSAQNPSTAEDCTFPLSFQGLTAHLPPTRIFASFPHMHGHGLSIQAEHVRSGQVLQTFGQADHWSFDAQPNIPEDVNLLDGDTIRVTCTYTGFEGARTISFGERTEDEMCFEFLYTTPPISGYGIDIAFCPLQF
jgi:hypothetical protein